MFPVAFDELAMAEDLARLGEPGAEALAEFGRETERLGGLPRQRLLACEEEGRDGTRLGGCVETYVPWPAGRLGAVLARVGKRLLYNTPTMNRGEPNRRADRIENRRALGR